MTYEVQQTRWDRIIRRVSGSIGPGSRVSETISELFPMLDVENVPGELLLLGGTQLCCGQTTTGAGGAGFFTQSMLRNPGGSNALITITQVVIHSSTNQVMQCGPTLNTYANAGTQTIRDTRRFPPGEPVGRALHDTLLAVGSSFFTIRAQASVPFVLKDPNGVAVLAPGTAFSVSSTVANGNLIIGWLWRERPAEESELQF